MFTMFCILSQCLFSYNDNVVQESGRSSVRGRAAGKGLQGATSWRATPGLTQARRTSSVLSAKSDLCDQITSGLY